MLATFFLAAVENGAPGDQLQVIHDEQPTNPLSRFSRRAFAPDFHHAGRAGVVNPHGAEEIVPSASVMRRQSSRFRWPERNLCGVDLRDRRDEALGATTPSTFQG